MLKDRITEESSGDVVVHVSGIISEALNAFERFLEQKSILLQSFKSSSASKILSKRTKNVNAGARW